MPTALFYSPLLVLTSRQLPVMVSLLWVDLHHGTALVVRISDQVLRKRVPRVRCHLHMSESRRMVPFNAMTLKVTDRCVEMGIRRETVQIPTQLHERHSPEQLKRPCAILGLASFAMEKIVSSPVHALGVSLITVRLEDPPCLFAFLTLMVNKRLRQRVGTAGRWAGRREADRARVDDLSGRRRFEAASTAAAAAAVGSAILSALALIAVATIDMSDHHSRRMHRVVVKASGAHQVDGGTGHAFILHREAIHVCFQARGDLFRFDAQRSRVPVDLWRGRSLWRG